MILSSISRPLALAAIFAVLLALMLALVLLVGPALFFAVMILVGDEAPLDAARELGNYYASLASLGWMERLADGGFLVWIAILAGWTGLQVLFLSPIVGPPSVREEGRSLVPSAVSVALVATTGCALAWVVIVEGALALVASDRDSFRDNYESVVQGGWIPALGIWFTGGLIWYRLLRGAGAVRDPAGLDRQLRRLFAGTAVEAALGTLALLAVRRKHDCFCASASFIGLVYSTMVLFWLCGPWVVLLVTREARSQWARGACPQCGYPRRTDAGVCTECGHAFRAAETARENGARHVP